MVNKQKHTNRCTYKESVILTTLLGINHNNHRPTVGPLFFETIIPSIGGRMSLFRG